MLKPFFLIDSANFKKTSSFITESKSWKGMLVSFAGYSTYSLGGENFFEGACIFSNYTTEVLNSSS